nr:MAG TPA: hypothetical protein [Caudoviricetes sp.]
MYLFINYYVVNFIIDQKGIDNQCSFYFLL